MQTAAEQSDAFIYVRHASYRTRTAMSRKASSGTLPGCAPVGYRNTMQGIEPDPVLAPLIGEAFDLAASGMSLRMILREMTARGLVSRTGGILSIGALHYILHNSFYIGLITWNGKEIKGNHQPIISDKQFEAAQCTMSAKKRSRIEN